MIIKTESGSEYYIRNGIVTKKGDNYTAYKVWYTQAFPESIETEEELHDLPKSEPEVGKRLLIVGKDNWNITTKVVEIIEEDSD